MFKLTRQPRLFAQHPGIDFPKALVRGLHDRLKGKPPEEMARVHLVVNTRRMERRIREIFEKGAPSLLPKISLISNLDILGAQIDIAPSIHPLRRRLQVVQLVRRLLERQPDLAARSALFDLSDSLSGLFEEMEEEGVSPDAISDLDISQQSIHWDRTKKFIEITREFLDADNHGLSHQARQRYIAEALVDRWSVTPPDYPILLAGSTGSRGIAMLLMEAVSRLPQGAVIVPGFDYEMPERVWQTLSESQSDEDHPQFRYANLIHRLGIQVNEIRQWYVEEPPVQNRNKVMSLALRPAPVTDSWLEEGSRLKNIEDAFARVTLIEASSPRAEALAIALRLRQAAENNEKAALISPDAELSRQVVSALDQWDITPDIGAGQLLYLTSVGQFLRQIARLFHKQLNSERLLAILKHPITYQGEGRGTHLRATRHLELFLRRKGIPFPTKKNIEDYCADYDGLPKDWSTLLIQTTINARCHQELPLKEWVDRLMEFVGLLANPDKLTEESVWKDPAGSAAKKAIEELRQSAEYGGTMYAVEFADLLYAVLSREQVRYFNISHPDIAIWGTLEARAQGSDLLILGGLNDGVWPKAIPPDPWLNRQMRGNAGLLMPERIIGLSALDFQQAVAATEVFLTRAIRSSDSQTVPSRWLNRLSNLLAGLPSQGGEMALAQMRQRGKVWLSFTDQFEEVVPQTPASRPSPSPPIHSRPRELSVTAIKTLIRDPYAIYAKRVLRLRPLEPLVRMPDPRARGVVVHKILERFIDKVDDGVISLTEANLISIANQQLANNVTWPIARLLWCIRIERFAKWFVETEEIRRRNTIRVGSEVNARAEISELAFILKARADRIDRTSDGELIIYDYKTGAAPTAPQQEKFDKQLILEAVMAEQGAFEGIPAAKVKSAIFVSLNNPPKETPAPLYNDPAGKIWNEFIELMKKFLDPQTGYTSRSQVEKQSDQGDYDHLARFGEWEHTMKPQLEIFE
ncbi:MAG: double-strand break repair protein AddB [Aestuariivita sp.]|nr:double-strand break repair protein AddB [Aestuariivita sp.]